MALSEIDGIMRTTRSVRRRLDFEREVPREVVYDCIDTAVQAPCGRSLENWRFLVITDADKKQRIAELYRGTLERVQQARGAPMKSSQRALAARLHEMPLIILVCSLGTPDPESYPSQVAYFGSVLPAAWSLMIALRSRGLGSTWTTLLTGEESAVAELLGVPSEARQTVMLPVAYTKGAVLKPAARSAARDVTFWNRWGES